MAAKIIFPPDPGDGDLFEALPGLVFQFSKSENAWIRVDGINLPGLATPLRDGLMSSEDLKKLDSLLMPIPETTLKSEDCDFAFEEGLIDLVSRDGSLFVDTKAFLTNPAAPGSDQLVDRKLEHYTRL